MPVFPLLWNGILRVLPHKVVVMTKIILIFSVYIKHIGQSKHRVSALLIIIIHPLHRGLSFIILVKTLLISRVISVLLNLLNAL